MISEEKERYDIKNVDQAFGIIGDPEIKKIFDTFIADFSKEVHFQGIYTSKKGIAEDVMERVISGLNDEFIELKSKISEKRKAGDYVNIEDLKLLKFPLKVKMLKADFCMKNYEVVKSILSETQELIKKIDGNQKHEAD